MRHLPSNKCWAAGLILILAASARAESVPDPLRLMPAEADLILKIENPRQMVEALHYAEVLDRLQMVPGAREQLESTNVRRLWQLLAHYEEQLGQRRLELLESLTGGGIVFGVKIGPEPAPALLVIQSKDGQLLRKFWALTMDIVGSDAARQGNAIPISRTRHRDIEVVQINKDAFVAIAGAALLVSNVEKGLKKGLDLHLDGPSQSLAGSARVSEARKLLPPRPLAWLCLNLETTLHKALGDAKSMSVLTLFGAWYEVAQKSPFLAAGIYQQNEAYLATVRMPQGRRSLPQEVSGHLPPPAKTGSLPLLVPRQALLSTSVYLDLSQFWEHRGRILDQEQLKALTELEQKLGGALAGADLGGLLKQLGTHYRFVVSNTDKPLYATKPDQRLPAFGLVMDMKNPDSLSRSLESLLRTAAIVAGTQIRIKLVEETHRQKTIVGYRFVENVEFAADKANLRFNFSPCFVRVGDQFVLSSTVDFCRELIDLLETGSNGSSESGSTSPARVQLYASGAAAFLRSFEDQLVSQLVLSQAVHPDEARKQAGELFRLLSGLGTIGMETNYGEHDFRIDIRIAPGKAGAAKK